MDSNQDAPSLCPVCAKSGLKNRLMTYKLDRKGSTADFCESDKCSYPIDLGSFFDFVKAANNPHPPGSQKERSPAQKRPRRGKCLLNELRKSQKVANSINQFGSPSQSNDSGVLVPNNQSNSCTSSITSCLSSSRSPQNLCTSEISLQSSEKSVISSLNRDWSTVTHVKDQLRDFVHKIHCFWSQMDGKAWIDAILDVFVQQGCLYRQIVGDPLMTARITEQTDVSTHSLGTFFAFAEHVSLRIRAQSMIRQLLGTSLTPLGLFEAFGNPPQELLKSLRFMLDGIVANQEFQAQKRQILMSKETVCSTTTLSFDGELNFFNLLRRIISQSSNLAKFCSFEISHISVCGNCTKTDSQSIKRSFLEVEGRFTAEKTWFEVVSTCIDCGGEIVNEYRPVTLSSVLFVSTKGGLGTFDVNKAMLIGDSVYLMTTVVELQPKSGFPSCWFRDLRENSWMPSLWPEVSLSAYVFKKPELFEGCVRFVVYTKVDDFGGEESVRRDEGCWLSERDYRINLLRKIRNRNTHL